MKTFRLHLWREWREHRATLLFLALALPLLAGLAALRLPRRFVGDPWMAVSLMAIFVVVVLAAVGGALLGRERRGPGLRWLERLPGGLGQAFAAKLGVHLVTTVGAALLGFACAQLFAWLRGRGDYFWTSELHVTLPLVVALSAWTFACSAWALRGGTAILAAGLVLGLSGYPVLHVVLKHYRPSTMELVVGTSLATLAGLLSAALAFLRGNRLGTGSGSSIMLGLVPVLPLFVMNGIWSLDRIERRERLEPLAEDYDVYYTWVTEDGKAAFLAVCHHDPNWLDMPIHILRVDLVTGDWATVLRDYESHLVLSTMNERGLMRPSALVLNGYGTEQETVLSLLDGGPTSRSRDRTSWRPVGLGQWQWTPGVDEGRYYDPFRGRSYPESEIKRLQRGQFAEVFIRPGRWLIQSEGNWSLYDPDTGELETTDLPEHASLLALLPDGRALLRAFDLGLICFDPSTGVGTRLGDEYLAENDYGFRAPGLGQEFPETPDGPVVLSESWGDDLFVLDPASLTLSRVEDEWHLASFQDGTMLTWSKGFLVEIDLRSGARRTIFPQVPEG